MQTHNYYYLPFVPIMSNEFTLLVTLSINFISWDFCGTGQKIQLINFNRIQADLSLLQLTVKLMQKTPTALK